MPSMPGSSGRWRIPSRFYVTQASRLDRWGLSGWSGRRERWREGVSESPPSDSKKTCHECTLRFQMAFLAELPAHGGFDEPTRSFSRDGYWPRPTADQDAVLGPVGKPSGE